MAEKKTTQMKGVKEALKSLKGGSARKATSTKKKAPKKKAPKKKAPKRKTSKKKAPKQEAAKVSSGQGGPSIDLPLEKLNDREKRVVEALNGSGAGNREIFTIVDLAEACWKSKSRAQANSWVRNSLRRLIRGGIVEKVERGQYRIADAGRKKLARAA